MPQATTAVQEARTRPRGRYSTHANRIAQFTPAQLAFVYGNCCGVIHAAGTINIPCTYGPLGTVAELRITNASTGFAPNGVFGKKRNNCNTCHTAQNRLLKNERGSYFDSAVIGKMGLHQAESVDLCRPAYFAMIATYARIPYTLRR